MFSYRVLVSSSSLLPLLVLLDTEGAAGGALGMLLSLAYERPEPANGLEICRFFSSCAFLRSLRRQSSATTSASTMTPAAPAPTAIPIFAPTERPSSSPLEESSLPSELLPEAAAASAVLVPEPLVSVAASVDLVLVARVVGVEVVES